MLPAELIIVRHGETEWNCVERAMGWLDSSLTVRGERQASQLARRAAQAGLDRIVASDLGRAQHTAGSAAEACELRVDSDAGLRERNMGIFQGLTPAERIERYPAEVERYRTLGAGYVIPEGESAEHFSERSWAALQQIANASSGKRVLIVTHGGVLLSLFERHFALPFGSGRRFLRANATWNKFTVGPEGWRLDIWGDDSHLDA